MITLDNSAVRTVILVMRVLLDSIAAYLHIECFTVHEERRICEEQSREESIRTGIQQLLTDSAKEYGVALSF